ncbi:hypothetical protein ACLKA7_008703 [Drosophila subpalustris]
MFPGGNANADLGYNKHNQYMAQPPHFLAAPNPGTVPGPGVGNTLRTAAPVMPLNMQGGIDWAQLAQQWIHMRDSTPAAPLANFSMNMPIAPPPPIISNAPEYHQNRPELRQQPPKIQPIYEEHGEAEMDMDMDEEENENSERANHDINKTVPPPPPVATQSQWTDSGVNDASITVAPHDAAISGTQPWSNWPLRSNPTAHIPSLLKLNVCNPNESQQLLQPLQQPQTQQNNNSAVNIASSEIDANKRKMLPAWIREGLEKMEREKQRQLERQQPTSPENESLAINVKQVSSKTLTTPVNLLNISNVASDSEDSIAAPEIEEATHAPMASMAQLIGNDVLSKTNGSDEEQDNVEDKRQQESQHQDAVDRHKSTVARSANAEAALSGKNYEERLADLMLVVRRTLTEILLETTNEEIAAIATETVKAHRAKASSAQVIRKSALSSITGNLGLAAYGDSSSDSEEDDNTDDNDGGQVETNLDSTTKETDKSTELTADELKARIRKSKRSFEKVIDDIEERVSLQEQMDEQKLQHYRKLELEQAKAANEQRRPVSGAESSLDDFATATTSAASHEKSQQFNGKRLSRKERTTRFSDNKDGKQTQSYVSQVTAVAAAQSNLMPQKLKPVPNPATHLLQMPETMTTMLNAADKALDKARKTSKKAKTRRRQSSSSSSSSSSGDSRSSSSSSNSNSSSNSSKSSSNTEGSSTRSSLAVKKRSSSRRSRGSSSRKQRSETSRDRHRKGHSSSSSRQHTYSRHHSSRERERDRDRDRHAHQYSSQHNKRQRRRDSSYSGDENGSDYRRSSRHSSSRSHQSSSYGKHRDRTRSRSNSRSTHNSYSSTSTSHQQRKRH